ncbi:hypothetical protein ABE893_11205 [Enterococcus entomosocium]|uniref:hypothetical protein n=1 Tax=Enterococcus entomosocium TaxID=3034352 RepID=UPI003D6A64C9
MSGKLIIQGKAWGEFESAKRSKGSIEISGYRSYGGTHTVRMVDQPQINENQQIVLGYLKEMMISFDLCNAIYRLKSAEDWGNASEPYDIAYESLNDKERLQVVQAACQWAQEWEEPV